MDENEKNEIENLISYDDNENNEADLKEADGDKVVTPDVAYDSVDYDGDDTDTDEDDWDDEDDEEEDEDDTLSAQVDSDDYYDEEDAFYEEEKKVKKPLSKRARIIKWSAIGAFIVAFIIVFTVVDTGIIGAYKTNFKHNYYKLFGPPKVHNEAEDKEVEEALSEPDYEMVETEVSEDKGKYNTEYKTSIVVPYEYANESVYAAYKGGLLCAATNYMCFINTSGELEWEIATSVVDPILRTAGNYILIVQDGGTKLCLYNNNELLYDTDCEDKILSASLSKSGDSVLVTAKDLYKGAIAAYNKSGKLIYSHASGTDSIIDATISPITRDIAVALLNTDEAVKSAVEIFDITKEEKKTRTEFSDTILFDIEYFDAKLCASGDNAVVGIDKNGKCTYDLRFEDGKISHYTFDDDGYRLVLCEEDNVPTLISFSLGGRQKTAISVFEMPDFLEISQSRMLYNMGRDIVISKTNGKSASRYTASMDIRDLIMCDEKSFFIVYSNSVEFVRMR